MSSGVQKYWAQNYFKCVSMLPTSEKSYFLKCPDIDLGCLTLSHSGLKILAYMYLCFIINVSESFRQAIKAFSKEQCRLEPLENETPIWQNTWLYNSTHSGIWKIASLTDKCSSGRKIKMKHLPGQFFLITSLLVFPNIFQINVLFSL